MKAQWKVTFLFLLAILLVVGWSVYASIGVVRDIGEQDIYYSYLEGQRILQGENPYERILSGDMRVNNKYATYFPLFYEFSALLQALGRKGFEGWIAFWHPVFIICCLAIGALLFFSFWSSGLELFGIFATAFWLFNRWTLTVISIVHLDFLALLPLVASLLVFPKHHRLGLLLYSLSLAFKQIAIFLLPLYIIWMFLSLDKDRWKKVVEAALVIGSFPLLSSIPFLIWNVKGFVLSILFSFLRSGASAFSAYSLDDFLDWDGFLGRLPMLALLICVYWLFFSRQLRWYTGVFLVMSAFVGFNSVLYIQYMVWLVPLALLLVLDFNERSLTSAVGD
jgi:hypothetical protein